MNQSDVLKEQYNHFINGQWTKPASGRYFNGYNPATGEQLTAFAQANKDDIDYAVENAQAGFKAWSSLKPSQRSQILLNIADQIRKNKQELAYLETIDTSRPFRFSEQIVETSARFFEYMGGAADKIMSEVIPASNDHLTYTLREPFGVIGHIIPWNAPIQTASRDIASAFAAGNAVVTKISEHAGISVLELARICVESGMPPGVFNVVNGYGPEAGAALTNHSGVRKITFTGSVPTGQQVMKVAAERIVPVTVELGGKSPNIVFEDANLDEAATVSLRAFTFNSGQVCAATTRLLVQRSILDQFVEKLVDKAKALKVGNGFEDSMVGPLITEQQMNSVLKYIEAGKHEGAELVHGGNRLQGQQTKDGYFIEPTIFTNVTNEMTIAREEIFGPVASIIPFETEEEAIEIANNTEYGLAAMLWTDNVHRAHRVAKHIQSGEVYINDFMPIAVEAPFGGYKKSGIGREKGLESLRSYTQVKTISLKINE